MQRGGLFQNTMYFKPPFSTKKLPLKGGHHLSAFSFSKQRRVANVEKFDNLFFKLEALLDYSVLEVSVRSGWVDQFPESLKIGMFFCS